MGYGEDLSLLPVAGSFFLADDLLEREGVHPADEETPLRRGPRRRRHPRRLDHRFGPTAKVVPTLERGEYRTVQDFLDVFGLSAASVLSYGNILADRILLPYVLRNLVYDVPEAGGRAFLPTSRRSSRTSTSKTSSVPGATAASAPRSSTPPEVPRHGRGEDRRRRRHLQHHALAGGLDLSQERDEGRSHAGRLFRRRIEFDGRPSRAATIGNFPRADGAAAGSVGDAAADEADAAAADD